jgi:hypothetical protein
MIRQIDAASLNIRYSSNAPRRAPVTPAQWAPWQYQVRIQSAFTTDLGAAVSIR